MAEEWRMCLELMSYLSPASVRILLRVSLLTCSRFSTAGDGSEPKTDSKCAVELPEIVENNRFDLLAVFADFCLYVLNVATYLVRVRIMFCFFGKSV